MKDFRELKVWQKSHELTLKVYKISISFPKDERYGITSQVRRSSASIAANIAEGCGRNGDPELTRFLQIAMGSASETEYHLLLAHDLKFVDTEEYLQLNSDICEIKKMLASFILKLKADR